MGRGHHVALVLAFPMFAIVAPLRYLQVTRDYNFTAFVS